MEAQRNELLNLVHENGWKSSKLDNYEFQNRSTETWFLESTWSPINAIAFISFLIDPMSNTQNPYPWAIEIANKNPIQYEKTDIFLVSMKQWKNEKDNFVRFLDDLRSENKTTENM